MPAWLWITPLAAVAFAALVTVCRGWWRVRWVLDWLRVLDARRWWYSWQRAAHVVEAPLEPLPEYPLPWPPVEGDWLPAPPDFYGSMSLADEAGYPARAGDFMVNTGDLIYGIDPVPWEDLQSDARNEAGPDWREQTAASLSPEALLDEVGVLCAGCAGFEHCDGIEGACNCTCGFPEDWAEADDDPGPGDLPSLDPGPDPGPVIDMGYLSLPAETQEAVEWALLEHKVPDIAAFMRAQDDDVRADCSARALGWQDFMRDLTAALA